MKNIKTIISEEINRYIITENIQTLGQLGNELNVLLQNVCKKDTSNLNQAANNFIYQIEYFVTQIVFAIKRCVQANNLNEGLFSGLNFTSGWGINIPPELGGNFFNDYRRGYYNTKNFFNRKSFKNQNNKSYGKYNKINTSNVRSEKLSSLLGRLNQMYQNYLVGEAKYQLPQYAPQISQGMRNIFSKINEIYKQYNNLLQTQNQNAQGQNP